MPVSSLSLYKKAAGWKNIPTIVPIMENNMVMTVGDVEVTEDNMLDVLGDGTVKYDGTGKLTLNNATITGTDYALRTRVSKPLEIEVKGTCTLKRTKTDAANSATVSVATITTFTGTGTMNVTGSVKTFGEGTHTIKKLTINCTDGFYSGQQMDYLVVESGTLIVENYTINGFKSLTLGNGCTIQKPKGGSYNASKKSIVDANGKVVTAGGVIISSSQIVEPDIMPTGISLNKTTLTMTAIGETAPLTATVTPTDATDKTVRWSSDNTGVATVSNGVVTAKGSGTANITASTVNDKTAKCKVTVTINTTVKATGLTLNKEQLTLRIFEGGYAESEKLVATVTPANTTNKDVRWESDNSSVASVDGYGRVQAVSCGETIIRCTTLDGSNLKATCAVSVKESWEVDDDFMVEVRDYVYMKFRITDRTNKYCEVPGFYDSFMFVNEPAIDIYTDGEITIPAVAQNFQVKRVGDYAFYECDQVTAFTLPEGLEVIGYEAFSRCYALQRVDLPSTLTCIDDYAFLGSFDVRDVYLLATTPPQTGLNAFGFGDHYDVTGQLVSTPHVLHVPAASLKAYKQEPWTEWFTKIEPIGAVPVEDGDANGDDKVDIVDVTSTISHILGQTPDNFNEDAADVNHDSKVDIVDVTTIIDMILKN